MKLFVKKASFILLAGALLVSAASAGRITLNASADTYVRADQGSPTSPANGAATFMFVGQTDLTKQFHSLLTFDLSSLAGQLPVNARIDSVTLQLAIESNDANSPDASMSIDLYELTQSYDAATANWATREGKSVVWDTPGGTYNGTVLMGEAIVPMRGDVGATYLWSSAALLNLFEQTYSDSGELNLLLKRRGDSATSRELVRFVSMENALAATLGPRLIIDYTLIPETSGASLVLGLGAAAVVLLVGRRRLRG